MPNRPGVQIIQRTVPTPRSAPVDSGTWFAVGLCDFGPINRPIEIHSMDEFNTKCGGRVSYSVMYDALDTFFREGGSHAFIGRVVGPAAVQASRNLVDNAAAVSLVVKAVGPGTSGNAIKVGVVAGVGGGTFQIQVTDANSVVLEQSPDLTTQADAVAWSQSYAQYVIITTGASALVPIVGGANVITAMTGGTDDRNNITDTQWLAALNLFVKDYGPGQVSAPGRTTATGMTQLLDHAAANGRTAILDAPDTATSATLTTSATSAKTTGNGQYGGLFAPWVIVPGIVAGTTRTVPPSGLVAGLCAKVSGSDGPNVPAAGAKGISNYAIGLSQAGWDDATRNTLNNAGVNVIRSMLSFGDIRVFGWRSLADPQNNSAWLDLGNVRLLAEIQAEAWAIGQQYIFSQIDGQGHTIAAYGGALTAMLQRYFESGQIYGAVPSEAFVVDVGPTVNTLAVLAGNELRAAIAVRPSPMAELVTIIIVNVPVPQEVS
jgi:phage tail sheath protein FI